MGIMRSPKGRLVALAAGAIVVVVLAAASILGWPHPIFWYRFKAIGKNAQGYFEYWHLGQFLIGPSVYLHRRLWLPSFGFLSLNFSHE
jgi:hypothetical protein